MDVYDTLKGNIAGLVAKWREANGDQKLEAKEVGALLILAGQSLVWTIGVGRSDGLAIQTAAERLFDEVFGPFVLLTAEKVIPVKPWYMRIVKFFALRTAKDHLPDAREYYVQMISGALQAMGMVVVTERTNAQTDNDRGVGAIPPGMLLGHSGNVVGGLEHRPYGSCLTSVDDVQGALGV